MNPNGGTDGGGGSDRDERLPLPCDVGAAGRPQWHEQQRTLAVFSSCLADPDKFAQLAYNCTGDGHVWIRDRGPELGIGGLARSGDLTVTGDDRGFTRRGAIAELDSVTDLNRVLTGRGANLYGGVAHVPVSVRRPIRSDQLEDMPYGLGNSLAGDPAILYRPRLHGQRHELRGQGSAVRIRLARRWGCVFGLFRCDNKAPVCTKVAAIREGYGTTGVEVVASIPLAGIGLKDGGELSVASAFTALGSYAGGAVKVLDRVMLT